MRGQRSFIALAAFVGSRDTSDKPKSEASISAPTDVASLPGHEAEVSDPFEKSIAQRLSGTCVSTILVIYPAAKAYHNVVPEPVRNSIDNFDRTGPTVVFANDVLQLRLEAAATTVGRFAINSTVGVGGLFDVATKQKLEQQSGDSGRLFTFGV